MAILPKLLFYSDEMGALTQLWIGTTSEAKSLDGKVNQEHVCIIIDPMFPF